jgi:thioredoxin-like negative regulator of GroEL
MKKNIIIILAILILPAAAYWGLTRSTAAVAEAGVNGKPQVIKFTSTMCLDCQKMNKVFEVLKPRYGDRIAFTEVNVQNPTAASGELIKKHNITLVPTIILFDSRGKQVARIEDAIPESKMDRYLKELK